MPDISALFYELHVFPDEGCVGHVVKSVMHQAHNLHVGGTLSNDDLDAIERLKKAASCSRSWSQARSSKERAAYLCRCDAGTGHRPGKSRGITVLANVPAGPDGRTAGNRRKRPGTTDPPGKRLFDIAASGMDCYCFLPLVITAAAIRIESRGRSSAAQAGSNYRVFDFFKFRSMCSKRT